MSDHAKFSPSNSKRWLSCSASMTLPEVKEKQSSYANRGTSLHAMSEDILCKNEVKDSYEGYAPTEEDIKLTVEPYVEYVQNLDADRFFFEKKVFITEECYGTADVIAYNTKTKELHVVDLKAGTGIYVVAKDNTQLQIYAIGALKLAREQDWKVEKVFVHIVQPGIDNICCVEVNKTNLIELQSKVLKAIHDVKNGNVKYAASEEGCRWCAHKTTCKELNKLANRVAQDDFAGFDLADKLEMVPALKLFIKAVEEESHLLLGQGKELPGFKLVRSRGRRVWLNEDGALSRLEREGIPQAKLFTPGKILTPTQIEKVVKKEKLNIDLTDFIIMKEGAPKVVPESNKGEAINKLAEAKNDFTN